MKIDEYVHSDAAYILGALSPQERREYETHLAGCATCTRSVAELKGLPARMSSVSVGQLTAALPMTLLPSLARAVRPVRRRRRLAVGATAAAAACLIAVATVALTRPDSPTRPPVASSASAPSGTANLRLTAVVPSQVTASARLVDMAWGTRIDLTCAYRTKGLDAAKFDSAKFDAAKGVPYALVVIGSNGSSEQVGTWKALPDRELTVMGASSRVRRDIAAVEIRTLSGRAILRLST